MAGGVGAAAVWRERTGQAQELSIDLRQALYGIAPWARFLAACRTEFLQLVFEPAFPRCGGGRRPVGLCGRCD